MAGEPLLERLPPLVQNERRRDQIRVEFDDNKDVYKLPNAPVLDVHGVYDDNTTYIRQTDYEIIEDADGRLIEIDWSFGGDQPDDGTDFIVDATFRTIIERYSAAHDDEFELIDDEIDEVIEARQIDNAEGDELDELGALYGALGNRRGRSDSDYRAFLKSITQSFNGRGSVSGLKFAIASSIGTDTENVEVIEDFENLEYDIQVSNVNTTFISSAINDLAELADPSVVKLNQAIIILDTNGILIGGGGSTVTTSTAGLGGDTLTLDGNSTLGGTTTTTATYDSTNYDNSNYD